MLAWLCRLSTPRWPGVKPGLSVPLPCPRHHVLQAHPLPALASTTAPALGLPGHQPMAKVGGMNNSLMAGMRACVPGCVWGILEGMHHVQDRWHGMHLHLCMTHRLSRCASSSRSISITFCPHCEAQIGHAGICSSPER